MTDTRSGAPARPALAPRRRSTDLLAALAGVLAAALTLGVAELVAIFVGPRSAPIISVGQGVIRLTPEPVKEFAIKQFGSHDKQALVAGTCVLVAIVAALAGVVAVRRLAAGIGLVVLLGVVALVAAVTDPGRTGPSWLPSVVGVLAGALALVALVRLLLGQPVLAGSSRPRRTGLGSPRAQGDRRAFLLGSGAVLGLAAVGNIVGQQVLAARSSVAKARAALRLPKAKTVEAAVPAGADLGIAGVTPFTTQARDFYRVDTAIVVPQVDPVSYRLKLHGMVERPMTLTLDDLLKRDLIERETTITCVSNEVGGALTGSGRWLGVPLRPLLDELGLRPGADLAFATSVDGWNTGTPVSSWRETEGAMLAVGFNGEPLLPQHGFPVRVLVPGLYGYVSATKWVTDIEFAPMSKVRDGYWVKRGWAAVAPIKTEARIDVPQGLRTVKRGVPIPVAGVAWAQSRGIGKVEVRINGGPWNEARLAPVPNADTWRQWVWSWTPDKPGQALIEARVTDATGKPQDEQQRPIFPDGATGLPNIVVTVA